MENLDKASGGADLQIKNVLTTNAINFNNSNLRSVAVYDSNLNELKFENENKMKQLSIFFSKIGSIDLEVAKYLGGIIVDRSEVGEMSDITKFENLQQMKISNNAKFPDLTISDLKSLKTFALSNNAGSHTIDLSTSDNLDGVDAKGTKMKSLTLQERMRTKAVSVTDEMVEKREWIQPSKTGPSGKEEE